MNHKNLRSLRLSDESIEFAKLNAGVVQPSRTGINPYYLGLKIFEDIEELFNNPTEEMIRRGVHMETMVEAKPILYTYDDSKGIYKKYL